MADPDKTPFRTTEATVPLADVRLVHALPHPESGVPRDVIIKELQSDFKNGPRFIVGVEPRIYIPYPSKPKPEHQEHDIDMLRLEVEEKTWTPTLLTAPMPTSVIDELRNKYSKFRDRHEEAYVTQKEASAKRQAWLEKNRELRGLTPLEEFNRKQRAERRKLGRRPLDNETLARIGELMARNKGMRPDGKEGVTEPSRS